MQTPEEVALSFTGECKPSAANGDCIVHRTPLGAAKTCLHVLHLSELIRARDAAVAARAWDEGCAAGLREANDKARGVQNNPAINPYERGD